MAALVVEASATQGLAVALISNISTCKVLTRYSDSFSEAKIPLLISLMMTTTFLAEDSAQWEWDLDLIG